MHLRDSAKGGAGKPPNPLAETRPDHACFLRGGSAPSPQEKDPYLVADAHARLLLARAAQPRRGTGLAAPLKEALKILRKRPATSSEGIVERASRALADMARPKKRVRGKRHPEEVV